MNPKKKGASKWKPGQSGNPSGSSAISRQIATLKKFNKVEAERVLSKFLNWPVDQLIEFIQDKSNQVLETLVARVLLEAIRKGDHSRAEWVLQRLIGKVKEEIEMNHTVNLHEEIVRIINDIEDEPNGKEKVLQAPEDDESFN